MKSFSLLFALLLSTSLFSQWQQTNGPEGGAAYSIERIDGVLWAGTQGGLYQSFDEGATWQRNETFQPEWSVTTVKTIGDEIFLSIYRIQNDFDGWSVLLYRSTDGGQTWDIADLTNFFFFPELGEMDIFRSGDKLFVWYDNRLLRSDDDGQTWQGIENNFDGYINKIGHDGQNLVAADYYQLFLSEDLGESWQPLDSISTQADILLEGDFIMVPSYDNLMISNDLGQTWGQYPLPSQYFSGRIRREASGKLYALSSFIYVSENNGLSWDTLNTEYVDIPKDFIEEADGEFTIAGNRGIYRTTGHGSIWQPHNTGIRAANVYRVFVAPWGEVFSQTNIGIFRSPNAGHNWFEWDAPLLYYQGMEMLWVGDTTYLTDGSRLFRSTDHCLSYEDVSPPGLNYGANALTAYGGKIYQTGDYSDQIYLTEDGGQTWDSLPGPANNQFSDYNHLEIVNGTMLLLDDDGEIYRSTDNGNSWSLVLEFWSPGVTYHRLYQSGNRVILTDGDGWFYSTDEGETWVELSPGGMPTLGDDAPQPSQLLPIGNLLFATLRFHGVYVSSDFGSTWQETNTGLGNHRSRSISSGGGAIYLGTTQGGIWSRGANFEGVGGMVFQDENGNGEREDGEGPMPGILIEAKPLNTYASSSIDGTFTLYAESLNDTIRAISPSPYATVSPAYYLANQTVTGKDFGIHFIPGMNDLCLASTATEPIRAGFGSTLVLSVSNVGTTDQSPLVWLLLPEGIDYDNASPLPTAFSGDTVFWQLDLMPAFSSQNISVEIFAETGLALGTELYFQSDVSPHADDQNPQNNFSRLFETVIGSYDPNDKTVSPNFLTPAQVAEGEKLVYTIRFQNTGTYLAENVRIEDELSEDLDISTLRVLAASHQPMEWHLRDGRLLEFVFVNIMLPDSAANEPGSHGFVKFSIEPRAGLSLGDEVENTADIFFDFNPAVVTNTALLPIDESNLTVETHRAGPLAIRPNPNAGDFQIFLPSGLSGRGRLSISDLSGRLLIDGQEAQVLDGKVEMPAMNLPMGSYFVHMAFGGKVFQGKTLVIK